jgi:surfeit locus 1 family protein
MKQLQFRIQQYVFRPTLIGTVLTLICIPLFIKFGFWQYNKAQQKQAIQAAYHNAESSAALPFPTHISVVSAKEIEQWNYKKVKVTGHYETKYQFLLDNKVEQHQAGYHVITPFKIDQTAQYVLINRGWIAGMADRNQLPSFDTPKEQLTLEGQVWIPSKKIFTLEDQSAAPGPQNWQAVWQNMDLEKLQKSLPFAISPLAIKLDSGDQPGGLLRNWQVPADRITTHIGYAYQWFGFALAALLIFLYMSISRVNKESA